MLKLICQDYLLGVRDSLRGFWVFWSLDSDSPSKPKPDLPPTAPTILQQRREQKRQDLLKSESSEKPAEVPRARRRLLQCVGINVGCFLTGKILLDFVILPLALWVVRTMAVLLWTVGERVFTMVRGEFLGGVASVDSFVAMCEMTLSLLFGAFWVVPLFLITRAVNALWFQDIANAAVRALGRKRKEGAFARSVADFSLAIVLETCFLLQAFLVAKCVPLPIVAEFFGFVHLTLLYALYAFEYAWMSSGIQLNERLRRIESAWGYYAGFGTLLTAATWFSPSYIVSGCLFGALFPFFIVSSFASPRLFEGGEREVKLNLFEPSVRVANWVSVGVLRRWMRRV